MAAGALTLVALCVAAPERFGGGWRPALATAAPETLDMAARKQAAAASLRKLVTLSKASESYRELRRALDSVLIPALKESASGAFPSAPEATPEMLDTIAKTLTFLDYLNKAGDEVEIALARHGDQMIDEAAEIIARDETGKTLRDLQALVDLPGTGKAFETFHAMVRLFTGLDLMDTRAIAAFRMWAGQFELGGQDFNFSLPNQPRNAPTPERLGKAQSLVTDTLTISRLEDVIERMMRFARDVYAPAAPLSEDERQALLDRIEEFELSYGLQKAVALSLAPVIMASMLTDDQMDVIHAFVRSPAFGKAASLYFDLIRAGTSFTKEDIAEADKLLGRLGAREGAPSPDENSQMEQAWQDYIDRWTKTISDAISPEVRAGLERARAALYGEGVPL
jgi:hypothetical protein